MVGMMVQLTKLLTVWVQPPSRTEWTLRTNCQVYPVISSHPTEWGRQNLKVLFTFLRFVSFIWVSVLPTANLCTTCVPTALRGQNTLYPPTNEIIDGLRHWMGAGNWTQNLCKSNKCSQPQSHSPAPKIFFKLLNFTNIVTPLCVLFCYFIFLYHFIRGHLLCILGLQNYFRF